MYFVISIKSISNLVCLSVDPLTVNTVDSLGTSFYRVSRSRHRVAVDPELERNEEAKYFRDRCLWKFWAEALHKIDINVIRYEKVLYEKVRRQASIAKLWVKSDRGSINSHGTEYFSSRRFAQSE